MKRINLLMYSLLIIVVFSACEKDKVVTNDFEGESSVKDEMTTEELLAQGWVGLGSIKVTPDMIKFESNESKSILKKSSLKGAKLTSATKIDRQKVTYDDLRNIDPNYVNLDYMKNRFTWALNRGSRRPKGISINSVKLGSSSVNPSLRYGWETYRYFTTNVQEDPAPVTGGWEIVPGVPDMTIPNYTYEDEEKDSDNSLVKITNGYTTSYEVSNSASLTISSTFEVPLSAEVGAELSVSVGSTSGNSTSKVIELSPPTGTIVIPKRKAVRLMLRQRKVNYKKVWSVPVRMEGLVGAHYDKKVDGHYFWAKGASQIFYECTNGQRKYTVDVKETMTTELQWFQRVVNLETL